ncbi:MAG: hypothetical protein OXF01_08250 [Gemmatimonadetes bacterium]|nr:hypothetical protein [Gemmatimonadota bacterium]
MTVDNPANGILTPPRMGDLADQLEGAIGTMRQWGIRIPPTSRLPEIVKLLRELVSEESFPECASRRAMIAQAARDAQEFVEISWVLPDERLRPLRRNLQQAVFGTLGHTRDRAYQYQSELWTGATLTRSGAFTGVRMDGPEGTNPDFILKNATKEYAVEVKRPANLDRARDRVSKAANQLRNSRYHGGLIVVDLTDCLDPESRDLSGRGPFNTARRTRVAAKVEELTNAVRKKVFDDSSERIRRRWSHVFGLVSFVRTTWWDLDDLWQMHLLRYVLRIHFWRGVKDLRYWRAQWLAELIERGIGETGHQDMGGGEIAFDRSRG